MSIARYCGAVAAGAVAGVVVAAVAGAVVLTFGPESLLEWGDIVYGPDGSYMGMR